MRTSIDSRDALLSTTSIQPLLLHAIAHTRFYINPFILFSFFFRFKLRVLILAKNGFCSLFSCTSFILN
ncbi:hypothetical protein CW304_02080 [Bacillus sp. UFRGS-B20]|nr:hypothetical protein CW304_02080 [Bacillus sp. UFRGS-B20]